MNNKVNILITFFYFIRFSILILVCHHFWISNFNMRIRLTSHLSSTHRVRQEVKSSSASCLTSSVREEVEKTLLMMALSPIPLTWQNRGWRAQCSSNLQLRAAQAEFKLPRSSWLLIAALLWDTTEGRQAHNERCTAATVHAGNRLRRRK